MQPPLRHPPPFVLTVGRDPAWSLINAGLAGMAAAALLLALAMHWGAQVGWAAPAVPLLMSLWWHWSGPADGHLRWDGQAWQLQAQPDDEIAVCVKVALDFDSWLLLRLVGPGRRSALAPHYLALSRRRHAAQWPLLRATLYAEQAPKHA